MTRYVIDTNVAIVANQLRLVRPKSTAPLDCVIAAIEFLVEAIENHEIFVDQAGEIQNEYRKHLNPKGQPGVGDRFYQLVLNSQPGRITRLDAAKGADGEFLSLPEHLVTVGFDPSDRKFVAVAVLAEAKVANCVDSDWLEYIELLNWSGIDVQFVCGTAAATRVKT